VLELYGASSACGDPPWFFVSPYLEKGSLIKYLKGLSAKAKQEGKVGNGEENVDMLKMMHEVARGMEYLHGKGVLHGDLKVRPLCFLPSIAD
jgi:abelson tyrosine-protein kinase 1